MNDTEILKSQTAEAKSNFSFFFKVNVLYLFIGVVILSVFKNDFRITLSFSLGWFFCVLNLFILSKIALFLFLLLQVSKLNPLLIGFLVAKISIWGLLIALFTYLKWIEGISFAAGVLTVIFSGFLFGIREFLYARTS